LFRYFISLQDNMPETISLPKELSSIEEDAMAINFNGHGLLSDIHIYLSVIRRFAWLFIISFLIAGGISFWYLQSNATYSAKARFIITDWSQPYAMEGNAGIYSSDKINRTLTLFLSDSVMEFVIQKYHLDSVFKMEKTLYANERLDRKISRWISLNQDQFNSFQLQVQSPDRILSASIANDIVKKVSEMSRGMYVNELGNRIHAMKTLMNSVPGSDSIPDNYLTNRFSDIQQKLNEVSLQRVSSDELKSVMSSLDALEKDYNERLTQLRLSEFMLKQVSENGAGSLILIQRAVPDFTNCLLSWLIYSLVLAVIFCSLLPLPIYFYFKSRGKKWAL
jgi:hypothetical protein